ncbi:hypothetical protein [uncultured Algimonas sp.]|uniref:hypothetical protein n=1 Tax=uncultured Algimonas sp. TaxID=1547920 RepID=UPI002614F11E|nr:hypothetical protein [uncultured Algimonas sp.]
MADAPIDIDVTARPGSDFLALPYRLHAGDPVWRSPLRMERRAQLGPRNPARRFIKPAFMVARRSGQAVGRIAAFVNEAHDAQHAPGTAFFGYFDCIDDADVADALLRAAKAWAREKGCRTLRGPAMWSVNEEVGLLVNGFEHPPAIMMPYGQPFQLQAVERNGFEKAIDLYAYQADLRGGAPEGRLVDGLRAKARADDGLTWRSLDMADFMGDVDRARDIFNDAWSDNWGFIPFSDEQFAHMAKEMKPIMFREGFQIGFVDGEPAAFVWLIPDVNEAVRDLDGRLLPFGWAKLLWRLKRRKVAKGRIPLMGLKKEFQKGRRGVALTTEICCEAFDAGQAQGFETCELSWILEGNRSMTAICDLVDAELYKTYRMVEAAL